MSDYRRPLVFLLLLTLVITLPACSPLADPGQRLRFSQLEALGEWQGERSFRYLAIATPERPLDDEEAEAQRLRWLGQWLEERGLDPQVYRVVSRKAVFRREVEAGKIYDVFYDLRVPGPRN